jgi:hypothetical protein
MNKNVLGSFCSVNKVAVQYNLEWSSKSVVNLVITHSSARAFMFLTSHTISAYDIQCILQLLCTDNYHAPPISSKNSSLAVHFSQQQELP